jgi:hypothetical protein
MDGRFLIRAIGETIFPLGLLTIKLGGEKEESLLLKGTQTVRGDQRVNACYDFAKMDAKENLISEIQATIRGEINQVSEGTTEIDQIALNKMLQQTVEGSIRGLRLTETAFERYEIKSVERIDCFVLMTLKKSDYQKMKNTLASQVKALSPELSNALLNRSVNFFDEGSAQ